MPLIDTHVHFWNYHPTRDAWITEDMEVIRANFLPADYAKETSELEELTCIAVQADESEEETHFLLELAEAHENIAAVVGWTDFKSANIPARLEYWSRYPKLRGFRTILQGQPDELFYENKAFQEGIAQLSRFDLTYDLLLYQRQIDACSKLTARFPDQFFIIDHLAKPELGNNGFKSWLRQMREWARQPNIACKISGLFTEAPRWDWHSLDLLPYVIETFEAFGAGRVLFGSDWPVLKLAATYPRWWEYLQPFVETLSPDEQSAFKYKNAQHWYRIPESPLN